MTRNDNRRRRRFHSDRSSDHHSSLFFGPPVRSRGTTTGRKVGHKDRSLSRKRQKRQQQQQLGSGSGGRWWRGIRREGVTQSAREKERGRESHKTFSSTISLVDLLQFSRRRERNGFYKHAHKRGERHSSYITTILPPL